MTAPGMPTSIREDRNAARLAGAIIFFAGAIAGLAIGALAAAWLWCG